MHFEIMLPKQLFYDRLRLITETVQFFVSVLDIELLLHNTIRYDGTAI